MSDAKYAVWDAETTGIRVHEDRIVQFFFATADADGNLLETYEWFIDPGVPVPKEASDIHGFSDAFLSENGQSPEVALEEIRQVFTKYIHLTHCAFNMAFDLSILDAEFRRYGISERFGPYLASSVRLVDGLVIDRAKDKYRRGSRRLENVAAHYGIPFDPEAAHNAKYDVEITAKVAAAVAKRYGIPSNAEQAEMYRTWAVGLEEYLRRNDPDANVDGNWPLKLKEEA